MKIIEDLSKFKDMVLATSYNDKVTARSVSIIVNNDKIYFQTANTMEKYYQLTENCNVALTKGFYQVEGTAKSIGKWEQNPKLCEMYQTIHQSSYENYGLLPEEEVIEVTITNLKLWTYEDDKVYITNYNRLTDQVTKQLQSKA